MGGLCSSGAGLRPAAEERPAAAPRALSSGCSVVYTDISGIASLGTLGDFNSDGSATVKLDSGGPSMEVSVPASSIHMLPLSAHRSPSYRTRIGLETLDEQRTLRWVDLGRRALARLEASAPRAYRPIWSESQQRYLYHPSNQPLRTGLRTLPEGAAALPKEGGPEDVMLRSVPQKFSSFLTGWTGEFARLIFEHCHHRYSESIPCGLLLHMARQSRELFLAEKTVHRTSTPADGKLVIFGDTHGHLKDLVHVWLREGLPNQSTHYLFNGDICDRGDAADRGGMEAVQIWACVLSHKLAYPTAVHMNRGNHEDHHYSLHYGAKGFYGELDRRYTAEEAKALKLAFKDLCDALPLMTVVDEAVAVVHGGLPRFRQGSLNAASLQEIERIPRPLQVQTHAENRQDQIITDLLWSDPQAEKGIGPSSRGKSLVNYGPDVVTEFLAAHKLSLLVRSHEVASGCEWWHPFVSVEGSTVKPLSAEQQGFTITIFSASDYCGHYDTNLGGTIVLTGSAQRFQVVSHKAGDAAGSLKSPVAEHKVNGSVVEIVSVIVQNKGRLLAEFRSADKGSASTLSAEDFTACCSRVVPELPWKDICKDYAEQLLLRGGSVCYTQLLAKYRLEFRGPGGKDGMRLAFANQLFGSLLRAEQSLQQLQEQLSKATAEEFLAFLADSGCCIAPAQVQLLYTSLTAGKGSIFPNFVGSLSVAFRRKHAASAEAPKILSAFSQDLLRTHPEKSLATLLLEFFQAADADGSGFVEVPEMVRRLRLFPSLVAASETELQRLAEYMDDNRSGKISYVEAINGLCLECHSPADPAQLTPEVVLEDWLEATCSMLVFDYGLGTLVGLFEQALPPGETRCGPQVFKQVLQALPENPYGPSLSPQQLESLAVSLKLDQDGRFDYRNYLASFQIIDVER